MINLVFVPILILTLILILARLVMLISKNINNINTDAQEFVFIINIKCTSEQQNMGINRGGACVYICISVHTYIHMFTDFLAIRECTGFHR